MVRDMHLIRLLLLAMEGEVDVTDELSAYNLGTQYYHLRLLSDAGFVEYQRPRSGIMATMYRGGHRDYRLTWSGHEFLDAARSPSVWQAAINRLRDSGITVSVSVLRTLLTQIARDQLGIRED